MKRTIYFHVHYKVQVTIHKKPFIAQYTIMESDNDKHKKSFDDSQNVKLPSKKLMQYSNFHVEVLIDNAPGDLNRPNILPVESVNETYHESAFELSSSRSNIVNGNVVNSNLVNGNIVNGNVVNGSIVNGNSDASSAVNNNQNKICISHELDEATSSSAKIPGNIFYPKNSKKKREEIVLLVK